MHRGVAVPAQPDEVVVLGQDLARWSREVDLEHGHVAAEVGDVKDQVLRQVGDISPHDPADPQWRQAELVPRCADGAHPLDPEVPDEVRSAERGDEPPARSIDVDVDVEAGLGLEVVKRCGETGHILVGTGVGHPERRDHEDRVLVHSSQHLGDVHGVATGGHRDLPDLDVPVPGKLVPDDLDGTADQVGLVGGASCSLLPGSPTPLRRHPGQHAGLRGADG